MSIRRASVVGVWWVAACAPVDASLRIEPVHGIRDLVAVTQSPPREISWTSPGREQIRGDRVPAHALWPGDTWTVTARFRNGDVATDAITVPEPPGGNVLVILLDDVGVDKVSAYGDPASPATPTLDGLADRGMRFDRAYANPVCTPSRATLLTGRHAGRSGMGWIADTGTRDHALPLEALTLPEALADARTPEVWADSAVGKWHLAGPQFPDVLTHPNDSGFSWFGGLVGNPRYPEGWGYDRWEYNDNGTIEVREGYLTSATIDDALERVAAMPEPWLLYLPLNAAHTPWTRPPDALLPEPLPDVPNDVQSYNAVLQAADHEIGRLLDSIDPEVLARTTVIVVGDNGTPSHAVDDRFDPDRQKHTVYEGGVHVPLIVSGPHVAAPGESSGALVHLIDVFPTVAEIAGVPLMGPDDALTVGTPEGPRALDGRSWMAQLRDPEAPGRTYVYTEGFNPIGSGARTGIDRRMVRDDRYKLMRVGTQERLFDLANSSDDPDGPDLLELGDLSEEAAEAHRRLTSELDRLEREIQYEGR